MLMVSPTGARLQKSDHPGVPTSIAEIVTETVACANLGADALHLHVRDQAGRHSLDPGLYTEALAALARTLPGFPVQITTEAGGRFDPATQYALLETLRPAWASVSLREVIKDREIARRIYALCKAQETRVQHIIYDVKDAELLRMWQAEGVLGDSESVILVLGNYAARCPAKPTDLDVLLRHLPPVGRWMVCAFGPSEHACLLHAAARGGDLRVGFENSTVAQDGTPWPDTRSSVRMLTQSLEMAA